MYAHIFEGLACTRVRIDSVGAFGRALAPMAKAEHLVVFKLVAGRPKDVEDAEALIVLHPEIDLSEARRQIQELSELLDDDAPVAEFDRLARRARAGLRKASVKRTPARAPSQQRRKRKPPGARRTR